MISVENGSSVAALLSAVKLPALESRALLAHQLGIERERLVARPEERVAADAVERFHQLAQRRLQGEPLAYLLGQKEFYGRMFAVSRAVLVPRPETELLVELALRLGPRGRAHVLDLGTGSGCVAITLALERPDWQITATDLSLEALDVARANADRLLAHAVALRHGSWLDAISDGACFDLIVSNPPYVAAGDPHLQALRFEPLPALVADCDGLGCLNDIVASAAAYLVPGGWLALEHGNDQGRAVRELLVTRGWHEVKTHLDSAGLDRVTVAQTGAV